MLLITVWNSGFAHRHHQRELAEALRQTCVAKFDFQRGDIGVCMPEAQMDPSDATYITVEPFMPIRAITFDLAYALVETILEFWKGFELHRDVYLKVRNFDQALGNCQYKWASG